MNQPRAQAPRSIEWMGGSDGHLRLLDQTRLPRELAFVDCRSVECVWEAIRSLRVRGAPAIGIAAAYGVCLGVQDFRGRSEAEFFARLDEVCAYLKTSRPTAVNLFWAVDRLRARAEAMRGDAVERIYEALWKEARQIHEEDRATCHRIGRHGAPLLHGVAGVLTHCNTGGLATSEYGTALGVIFTAWDQGMRFGVYVDETRPLLQGARLTTWELQQHGIPATLICDSAAAQVMKEGLVQAVIVGADRIAANGDTANKIGTYGLAVLARAHGVPFYVAAPTSTFDLSLESGEQIPIEQRPGEEVTCGFGTPTAPEGIDVYNPAFDVTPAQLIKAIVTERGVIEPVDAARIRQLVASSQPIERAASDR